MRQRDPFTTIANGVNRCRHDAEALWYKLDAVRINAQKLKALGHDVQLSSSDKAMLQKLNATMDRVKELLG